MSHEHATVPVPVGLKPGSVVGGKYRVVRVLGAGGMGVVLAADHLVLKQRVALKVMLPGGPLGDEAARRFEREARIVASLRGEHIARVLDAGRTESGEPFIAMEYLAGTDLEAVVRRGPVAAQQAAAYVLAACEALAEAHASGIVHRDLKPANLFLTERPDGAPLVKVLDFGISKMVAGATYDGTVTTNAFLLGSPAFMSPEQARGARDIDARSDVWSLGVVLYRLCTADHPFKGSTPTELLARVLTDEPAPIPEALAVPAALQAIIARCLRKDRDERWPDVGALAEALATVAPPEDAVHARRARAMLDRSRSSEERAPTQLAIPVRARGSASGRRGLVAGGLVIVGATLALVLGLRRPPAPAASAAAEPERTAVILPPATPAVVADAGAPSVKVVARPRPGHPRAHRRDDDEAELFEQRQ